MEAIPLRTQITPRLANTETLPGENSPTILRLRRERPAPGRGPVRPLRYRWYPALKCVLDFAAAALLSVLALPVVMLAALSVKLTSKGPAFYSQTRVGQDGRVF